MGLSASGVGIHGTPDDASIGYSASHGCIRMHIPDAEWLFNHVGIGTTVFIVVPMPTWLKSHSASGDRKSTRLNSSLQIISYAVFCLKKKKYTRQSSPYETYYGKYSAATRWHASSTGSRRSRWSTIWSAYRSSEPTGIDFFSASAKLI